MKFKNNSNNCIQNALEFKINWSPGVYAITCQDELMSHIPNFFPRHIKQYNVKTNNLFTWWEYVSFLAFAV